MMPKEAAKEWKRVYDGERDLISALSERGISVPANTHIEDLAGIVRGNIPHVVCIYKKEFFYKCMQEVLPTMKVEPSYNPANLTWLFAQSPNLVSIPKVEGLDLASNMSYYAYDCPKVSGGVETGNLTKCESLESAFSSCVKLETISIGDAPVCMSIGNLANGCTSLRTVKIGDIPEVSSMSQSFLGCTSLMRVDMSPGGKLTSMNHTFARCSSLREVVGTLDVSSAGIAGLLDGCVSLEEIRLKGINDSIALHDKPNLSLESARYLINEAQSVTGKTIYLPQKLVDDHEDEMVELGEVASAKGWIINYR